MDIIRNPDGSLIVPVPAVRIHDIGTDVDPPSGVGTDHLAPDPTTHVIRPGEGGYDEALTKWDLEHHPDREPVISTATGREEAMSVVHAISTSPDHSVSEAVEALHDPQASGEALRHVLVGGVHSVEAFSAEVAEAEGGDPLASHLTTKIIGEVLAELEE